MEQDYILAFDTLYTTNQIQILKIAMPFLPASSQSTLAILIKYLELRQAITFQSNANPHANMEKKDIYSSPIHSKTDQFAIFQIISDFLEAILPFCSEKEKEIVNNLLQLKAAFDSYEQLKPMLSMLAATNSDDELQPDFLKSLLSEEQQQLFDLFSEEMKHELDP